MTKALKFVILLLNLAAAALMLAAAAQAHFSPEHVGRLAALGTFFQIWLAFNILFIIFCAFFDLKKCLISLFAIILVFGSERKTISIVRFDDEFPEDKKSIKILTYNVMAFDYNNPECPILDLLRQSDADIICLQEASWTERENRLNKKEFFKTTENFPYRHLHMKEWENGKRAYGMAIFSKLPICAERDFSFEDSYNSASAVSVAAGQDTFLLVNCHLESNKITQRDRNDLVNKTTDKTVLHGALTKMDRAAHKRAAQAETLAEFLRGEKRPAVVCGDFNDTAVSYTYKTVAGGLKDAFVGSGAGFGFSFFEHFFRFRIDYILTSKNIKRRNFRVGKTAGSDHRPVSCEISF